MSLATPVSGRPVRVLRVSAARSAKYVAPVYVITTGRTIVHWQTVGGSPILTLSCIVLCIGPGRQRRASVATIVRGLQWRFNGRSLPAVVVAIRLDIQRQETPATNTSFHRVRRSKLDPGRLETTPGAVELRRDYDDSNQVRARRHNMCRIM